MSYQFDKNYAAIHAIILYYAVRNFYIFFIECHHIFYFTMPTKMASLKTSREMYFKNYSKIYCPVWEYILNEFFFMDIVLQNTIRRGLGNATIKYKYIGTSFMIVYSSESLSETFKSNRSMAIIIDDFFNDYLGADI